MKELRKKVIQEMYKKKMGMYGSVMSCLDAVKYLYDEILQPEDVFIMSKGHGGPALQAVLDLDLTVHLDYNPKKGIKATTGSLGHGLPIAVGRAYAKKLKNESGHVYCMCGDGEMQEGSNWEALAISKRLNLTNLIPIIDWNKYQAIDSIEEVTGNEMGDLEEKLGAFGYYPVLLNGHDKDSLKYFKTIAEGFLSDRCISVILNTIKGKGIKYLEENPSVHVWNPTEEQYKKMLVDLS